MIETAPLPEDCPSITFAHRHRAIVVSSQYPLSRLFHLEVNHRGSKIDIGGWISEVQHDAAEKVHPVSLINRRFYCTSCTHHIVESSLSKVGREAGS